ncbi:hypothetical protein K504DRAFT_415997 [Pleomassaria siparia CBS 279.74]|uniref:Shugoshin n=1 Tax=Pleomassaria siparia CBS 279.74 TaxID=1314801 RepID=A0A6G1JW11_9PLEO|nr:hypothetical protein K504DRAFT_415997 [Pleomassaria siparia CBS 279.74]
MARLNEAPVAPNPSAEAMDAVKRRFLRQNRELAKTNSQQSIRIRTLENDASRLLAENLSLREQVLHLQSAFESQSNCPSFETIDAVRDKLEAKIQDLAGLVAELGQNPRKNKPPRRKSQMVATRRNPDERQWSGGLGLQDVHNAMLPTIVEGKFFPRKTMNEDELLDVLEYPDSQSPDIGPPPVSRFENEEPILYNNDHKPEEQPENPPDEPEPPLSANLETRKKRRESGPKLDLRRMSVFQSPPREVAVEEPTKSVRTSAKRKFSVQDDREKAEAPTEPFRFSRRNAPSFSDDDHSSEQEARSTSTGRPALGSKPVNTDPVLSPKKQRSSAASKPDKKASVTTKSSNGRLTITRKPMQDVPPLHIPIEQPDIVEVNLDSLPPKTPAADMIFSPPSTEPSTQRPDNKDTPPPGDFVSGQAGLDTRPSRRVRAQVSYKEPALNVKMRRPGKELVDAVQLPEKKMGVEPQVGLPSGRVSFQLGPGESNTAWNQVPSTSVRNAGEEVGSPLREKLDRREGGQGLDSGAIIEPPKLNSSAASNAISALLNASSSRRRTITTVEPESKSQQTVPKTNEPADLRAPATKSEEKDNLAIFDFTDSSPTDTKPRSDLQNPVKPSRRHSTIVSTSSTLETRRIDLEPRSRTNGTAPSLHARTESGGGSAVRSASTSSSSKSTLSSRGSVKERRPSTALLTSQSVTDLKVAVPDGPVPHISSRGTGTLRAERAASRRKSMMM